MPNPTMPTQARGAVLGQEEGERIPWPDGHLLVKAAGDQTGGAFAVLEDRSPAGRVGRHIHHREAEVFYVLEGQLTITCGEDTFLAGPGAFVYLPPDVPHAQEIHAGGARKLILCVPGGLEDFFRQVGAALTAGTMTAARWQAISDQHGIEWLE